MPDRRTAAISKDVLDRPLGELNAAEFLQALGTLRVPPQSLAILADKKKYELWIDEGTLPKVPVGELLEKLRGEKKKLELEKRLIIEDLPKRYTEFEFDPTRGIDPVIREELVTEIVNEVVNRLGR
jgi:hypothetical protein